ncbi:sister-chromatid cohesion protein 3 [Tanacetum coccineum]
MSHAVRGFVGATDDRHDHAAKSPIKIDTDNNVERIDYYIDTTNHPLTRFLDFMKILLQLIKSNRRKGFIRAVMHIRNRRSNTEPFSFLIRSFNAYINGVHDGQHLYEIGCKPLKKSARYFLECRFTNYGEAYYELMGFRSRNNLVGIQIGPNALRRYAEQVQRHQGQPNSWKRSNVVFALTFLEALRFTLIKLDAIHAFEHGYDITIQYDTKYAYMAYLPKLWGYVCAAVDGRITYDTAGLDPPQNLDHFRFPNNCNKLKHNSIYATAMVGLRTIPEDGGGGGGGGGGGRDNFIEDLGDLQSFPPLQGCSNVYRLVQI